MRDPTRESFPGNRGSWLIALAIAASVVLVIPYLRFFYILYFEVGTTFSFGYWPSGADLMDWVFELLWSVLAGLLIASIVRPPSGVMLALATACASNFNLYIHTRHHHFDPDVPWLWSVWAYVRFFVPIIGCGVGAMLRGKLVRGVIHE